MPMTDSRSRFAALRATMRLPVVCAPMFLVSGPEIVVAACRAGIIADEVVGTRHARRGAGGLLAFKSKGHGPRQASGAGPVDLE